jgi:hypothetical protein
MKLTNDDYTLAAVILGCDISIIRAITKIESKGNGFLSSGEVKILYEPFQFGRLTQHKWNGAIFSFDGMAYPISLKGKWSVPACRYGSERIQHKKLTFAKSLDNSAALQSCSWGLFQLMGFNYKLCGYQNVFDFVEAMNISEGKQLAAFCNFIVSVGLKEAFQSKKFKEIAIKFNGKSYHQNTPQIEDDYDYKLSEADKQYMTEVNTKINESNFEYFKNVKPLPLETIRKISL